MTEINLIVPLSMSINKMYFVQYGRKVLNTNGKKYKLNLGVMAMAEKIRQEWNMPPKEKKIVMEYQFYWPDLRKRDCDNYIKLVQDSFTGILYHDDHAVLPRIIDYSLDRKNPRIELKLFEKSKVLGAR